MKLKLFALATLGILGLTTCSEPCPEKINHADFTLSTNGIMTDTFASPSSIHLKANYPNAISYAWSFPNGQNTSNKSSFDIGIVNNEGNDIPVQLIVKYPPDTKCFPNDDGIDTLKKSFHILKRGGLPAWMGTFRGYSEDNPKHLFDVTILETPPLTDSMRTVCTSCCLGRCYTGLRLFNLPEGCGGGRTDIYIPVPIIDYNFASYYDFEFGLDFEAGNCKYSSGKGIITPDRNIRIDYYYMGDNEKIISKRFIGKKIK
jgi:hypothetical protein